MLLVHLFLCVIGAALFSRVASYVGFPSAINFVHFPLVVLSFLIILTKPKAFSIRRFIYAVVALFLVILSSAIINEAGLINVLLSLLLLIEPPLFVFCIASIQWSSGSILIFRRGILCIVIVHLMFIIYQRFILGYGGDDVVGILLDMGAGSHLSGAIALSSAVYFLLLGSELHGLFSIKYVTIYIPLAVILAATVVFSDAKQVFAAFIVASLLLTIISLYSLRKTIFLIFVILASSVGLYQMSQTFFPELIRWVELDLLKEGFAQKFSVFQEIYNGYDSFLNFLFGLGPGHTVGRLAMLLPEYLDQLGELGATTSSLTTKVWASHQGHYMSSSITGSSMFSLFFSWAGIFGDIGVMGLTVYVYIYYLVWKLISSDLFSKFLFICVIVFGWIFQWMEEPQYMLFAMGLIGLRWQQVQLSKNSKINYV